MLLRLYVKKEATEMSNVKKNALNTIRVFGSGNVKNVPEAPSSLVKLFNVVAEQYMTVPAEFLADVIRFLKSNGYVFKMRDLKSYTVIALQYQKP
jgi:hypothetical protein